ncbi:MAG: hypothetical protein KME17_00015 [Cyanosarcina radialis HA8281-LM2]|jgi:hypothetical protein|nr:hypothetical protein [Cyanosarcina radialis HA8281-LM2]
MNKLIVRIFSLPAMAAVFLTAFSINSSSMASQAIEDSCSTVKKDELRYLSCQLLALRIGTDNLGKIGQRSTHAPQKVVNQLGNYCKSAVLDSLKSPASARFSKGPHTMEIFIGIYAVIGGVDAQNSYGALLRNKYFCYFSNEPKKGLQILDVYISD